MGNRKIFLKTNVFDCALERIRWVFDEFENVVVSYSGGKDSTVTLELCLMVAREKGRLPLPVCFVDQEAEWMATIDEVKRVMYSPEVKPLWYQIPFKINNATSFSADYLNLWETSQEEKWIRPKDPIAKKDPIPGVTDWYDLFPAIVKYEYQNQKAAFIAGMRAEESPNRTSALTIRKKYKWITWAKTLHEKNQQYTFYPLYDWSYTDIWKSIHDHNWHYNKIYDYMYQYGIPTQEMRVSSLFHESSVKSLFFMQEIEKDNYNRLIQRLTGAATAAKMGYDNFYCPDDLPYMFKNWKEYRDYLLEHLIQNDEHREGFKKKFSELDQDHLWYAGDSLYRKEIQSILTNDFGFWKIGAMVVPRQHWDEFKRRKEARKNEAQPSNQ